MDGWGQSLNPEFKLTSLRLIQLSRTEEVMLAIGELQATAGPDQRITATAVTLDEKSPRPHLTGA